MGAPHAGHDHHHPEGVDPPELVEVDDGMFAYVQPDGTWFLNNTGFMVGDRGVVAIDTTSTERRTRDLLGAIASVTDRPVQTLVNTHHHGDHTHGNYLTRPATIIGHERCREEQLASGLVGTAMFPDVEWGDLEVEVPFVTFAESLTVWVDDLDVRLRHLGPAHTTNDVICWVPERGVLYAGDLLFNQVTPFMLFGSISGGLAACEHLRSLPAKTIVPGHGPVGGPEMIDDVVAYLTFVQDTARAGHEAGHSPLEAAQAADLGRFAEWGDDERIVGNLHRAYAELDGAEPGAPLDVLAAFGDMITWNGGEPLSCFA
jgi:cyclase